MVTSYTCILLVGLLLQTKESPSYSNPPVSPGIFSEELQNKIEENARLHRQVPYIAILIVSIIGCSVYCEIEKFDFV